MFMTMIMLFTWQATNDSRYQSPFTRCLEATYTNSDLQRNVDQAKDVIKDKLPVAANVGPLAYALGVNRQASFTSKNLSPIPNTVTTYKYDNRSESGSMNITWSLK